MLAQAPTTAERALETGTRGSGGDRTLVIDQAAEQLVFDELDGLRAEGYRFMAVSEERGEIDYGDDGVRVIDRPDRRLAERQARRPHYALSIAVADGADDGRRRVRLRVRLRRRRAVVGVAGRRAPGSTARRSIRRLASAADATGGSRCWGSSPPIRAGSRPRSTGCSTLPTACARSARSRHRCARWRGARFDGMVSLRALARRRCRRRPADRARGGRPGQLPLVR